MDMNSFSWTKIETGNNHTYSFGTESALQQILNFIYIYIFQGRIRAGVNHHNIQTFQYRVRTETILYHHAYEFQGRVKTGK